MLTINASSGPSRIHRLGLFAHEIISAGTKIAEYRAGFDQVLTPGQVDALPPAVREQFLRHAIYSAELACFVCDGDDGRFTNHAEQANSRQVGLASYATQTIQPGEEITLNYAEMGAEAPVVKAPSASVLVSTVRHPFGFAVHDRAGDTGFYIDRTKIGWGLFVDRPIKQGERLLTFTGPEISLAETLERGHFSFYAVQVGLGRYLDVEGCGGFVNHACEPSCAMRGVADLVALRDLEPGTEVTMDYSMSMLADAETMVCGCGSPKCRKVIASFDELPAVTREEFLRQGVVADFIVRHYAQGKATENP